MNEQQQIDLFLLEESTKKENKAFVASIMDFIVKYNIISLEDVANLTSQDWCRNNLHSSYPILKAVDPHRDLTLQLKDNPASKENRYYGQIYTFFNTPYVVTSQFYGLGKNGNSRDNRTPFYKWVLSKVKSTQSLMKEDNKPMTLPVPDTLKSIRNYISSRGFTYTPGLIENFYLSLKAKPFVILAGVSGTGKTRLVKLFAEAIGAAFKLVPVRPDWSDSSDLFGHVDLNGKFVPGAILEYIRQATDDPSRPYFLCLDEMNLARVEYYLSDFLSVIETRDMVDGHIRSEALITLSQYGTDANAAKRYGELLFPENLYIVGTVNMDETTFPFSKKVLDRANTIEFNKVELRPERYTGSDAVPLTLDNSFLQSEWLLLSECIGESEFVDDVCADLTKINAVLEKANAHVGYRIRDEICFYMLNNKKANEPIPRNDAFDNEILQKILPRIQGSSIAVRKVLCDLFRICATDHTQYTGDRDSDRMDKVLKDKTLCHYFQSAGKIAMMVRRFEEDGFTSYWL